MIRKMMNLQCKAGHRWFAPDPQVWVGRGCGYVVGATRSSSCTEPLTTIPKGRRR